MKYKIYMEGYVPQTAFLTVEAINPAEAEAIALEMAEDGEVYWEDCDQSCRRNEVIDIDDCEEITDDLEIASFEVFHEFVEQITLTEGVQE